MHNLAAILVGVLLSLFLIACALTLACDSCA
jgi:hypothetical protein